MTSSTPYNGFAEKKKKKKTMVNEALLTRTVCYQQANDHLGPGRDASLQLGLQRCTNRKGLSL
jgi:hypothetical protein